MIGRHHDAYVVQFGHPGANLGRQTPQLPVVKVGVAHVVRALVRNDVEGSMVTVVVLRFLGCATRLRAQIHRNDRAVSSIRSDLSSAPAVPEQLDGVSNTRTREHEVVE